MSMLNDEGRPGQQSNKAALSDFGPSLTRQSMLRETMINGIVERYARTGLMTYVARGTPIYTDVADVADYRGALEQMRNTETFFERLPAKLRLRFENNPVVFLDFVSDPANLPEMKELGLVAGVPPKSEVPVVPPGGPPAPVV